MAENKNDDSSIGIGLLVILIILGIIGKCSNPSSEGLVYNKMNPEESGFVYKFDKLISNINSLSNTAVESFYDMEKYEKLGKEDEEKKCKDKLWGAIKEMKQIDGDSFEELKATIAPEAMSSLKENLLLINNVIYGTEETYDNQKFLNYLKFYKAFSMKMSEREAVYKEQKHIVLSFKPRYIPVEVSSDGTFEIDMGVDTPIGNISLAHKNDSGVKTLIIIYKGMKRYFMLSKTSFDFYLPTEHGVRVTHDGGDTLVLEVM